ncbi:MAG: hypothetical protein WBL68_00835 [Nitrososphaeraceae archaeon]
MHTSIGPRETASSWSNATLNTRNFTMERGYSISEYSPYDPTCKKCGELDYLTSKALCNLTDFGHKCPRWGPINTVTLENGEQKKRNSHRGFL